MSAGEGDAFPNRHDGQPTDSRGPRASTRRLWLPRGEPRAATLRIDGQLRIGDRDDLERIRDVGQVHPWDSDVEILLLRPVSDDRRYTRDS